MLIVIPRAWLFPAESAWVHYGVTDRVDAYHLADFSALRTGKLSEIGSRQWTCYIPVLPHSTQAHSDLCHPGNSFRVFRVARIERGCRATGHLDLRLGTTRGGQASACQRQGAECG